MRGDLRSYAIATATALIGSFGLAAAAQGASDSAKSSLSPAQQQDVMKGLESAPTQSSTAAEQATIGTKLPDSVTTLPLPGSVTAQVPSTENYLYVKMADRVLLIHPDTGMVAEIITHDSATTGAGSGDSDQGNEK